MARFVIENSGPLRGKVRINGAKNSALPIIAASLLTEEQMIIEDIPYLNDVRHMCNILIEQGINVEFSENHSRLKIHSKSFSQASATYDTVNKLRASFLLFGPLLAKTGNAVIPLPGGCAIGARPVDLHLKGMAAMGAEILYDHGLVAANIKGKLKGATIYLDFPSVGATENIMMAASLAEGLTVIENAATEPEIVDLTMLLSSMGADIKGAGTDTIRINGVDKLKGTNYSVIPDRIEAGTYMIAAAISNGNVLIENIVPDHVKPVTAKLREAGIEIIENSNSVQVIGHGGYKALDIKTHPYPGFPTDMQAPMMSLLSLATGTSMIVETIFENRFMHAGELVRMGASVKVEGRSAIIEGTDNMTGAVVRATDLRAGAGLVIAGLSAYGITEVTEAEHIDRGYVNIERKLQSLGAKIRRVEDDSSAHEK